ncbi:MAG: secretin N-terminal domain-containing protein [Planctomycetaceae bacterium]
MRITMAMLTVALFGCLHAVAKEAKEEQVTLTLAKDQLVAQFLDGAARTIGRPILYDPNGQRFQKGQTMGVDMEWSVPKGRELDLIRSVLAFYEITLASVGPAGREILLAFDSRSTNNLVRNKAEFVPHQALEGYADRDGLYIATTLPVRHVENLTMLRAALTMMVTPAGIGRVHEVPGAKRIVLMDYAPSVVAMARIVKELDVDPETVVTETILLAHAEAVALAQTLKELFSAEAARPSPAAQAAQGAAPGPRIAAYAARNAIVVLATESDLARIREVVKQLDVQPSE